MLATSPARFQRIPRLRCRLPQPQPRQQADDHRHRDQRVDDEDAADPDRVIRKRQQQLRAVHGEGVEQRVRDQRQPDEQQPFAVRRADRAVQPGDQPGDDGCRQRQPEERVGLGAMKGEVPDRVPVGNQHVQVGQGVAGRPDQGSPQPGLAAEDGGADGGAEDDVGEGVQGRGGDRG